MRLFHVSEESNIAKFSPRIPDRADMDKSVGLIWAIDEKHLPNYLTPRKCPRVTYHTGEKTTPQDRKKFFSSGDKTHAVIMEKKWLETVETTTLYLYEFNPCGFYLQDEIAGYYVCESEQKPINKFVVGDLPAELAKRNVQVEFVDNLWQIAQEVQKSTLNWSLCRMSFAQPKTSGGNNKK